MMNLVEPILKLGFKFGDSLDLSFSNNVKYNDIGYYSGYYSGYYVPAGQELVVGYPGYDYVKFCINLQYSSHCFTEFNFNNRCSSVVSNISHVPKC